MDLTSQQLALISSIPPAIGLAQEKDWAPVMSQGAWDQLEKLPAGLVEMHERFAPIMAHQGRHVLGKGYCRLTGAGRAALAQATTSAA